MEKIYEDEELKNNNNELSNSNDLLNDIQQMRDYAENNKNSKYHKSDQIGNSSFKN